MVRSYEEADRKQHAAITQLAEIPGAQVLGAGQKPYGIDLGFKGHWMWFRAEYQYDSFKVELRSVPTELVERLAEVCRDYEAEQAA
jgi:hypothetical protein